jgi:maleate isomerase
MTPVNDSLAYRAKIGVVVPTTNTVVQPEFEAMRPAGVTNHVTRVYLPPRPYDDMEVYRKALETEESNIEDALKWLLPCAPHVVAHGHSIHSFRGNRGVAEAEAKKLSDFCGVPFVTPSTAVLAGLEAMGNPKRIGVLTPYWPPADQLIAEFFTACGYEVVASHGLKAKGPLAVAQFSPQQIRDGLKHLDDPRIEALIHVGTNLPVSGMTAEIEATHGKPLVGVNVATYWKALRSIGITDRVAGFGRLLAEY